MIVKIHQRGRSFRGIARYLLHDRNATTSARVEWTANVGIATRDPNVGWRIMAATALDQDRLKTAAGVANSGRRSDMVVQHLSLAWHPSEAKKLTQLEMLRAAKTVLVVMGASEHQAMVVAHNDGVPHVHLVVNRINPNTGRMLSSSFEKLKASQWAQKYEQERGKVFCEARVINNAARRRGEYTRGKKDKSRQVVQIEKSSLDPAKKKALIEQHRRVSAQLKASERSQQARHHRDRSLLRDRYKQKLVSINDRAKREIAVARTQIQKHYRPLWEARHHAHRAALRGFEVREAKALGRMKNTLKAVDFASLIGRRSRQNDGRARTIAEAFTLIGNSGARLRALQRQHEVANARLSREQKREEAASRRSVLATKEENRKQTRSAFLAERNSLLLTQRMEKAKLKAEWQEKQRSMRVELRAIVPVPQRGSREVGLKAAFNTAAKPAAREQTGTDAAKAPVRPQPSKTSSADLLPRQNAEQAAKQIDQYKALLDRLRNRDLGRSADRSEGRER